MRSVSKSWKKDLKRRAAFALAASIVLALTSCKPQKQAIIRQQAIPVPVLKIDTAFVFNRDTVFRIDTDTFLIETIIRDTLISQHIETKPFFIRSTDTVYINEKTEQKSEQKQTEEAKQIKKERNIATGLLLVVSLLLFMLTRKK